MPDNPTIVENRWFALPGHAVLALTGPDAVKFAQAQFMNDVAALPDGHWQWNGWLTPKGRVISLFALLKFDKENLWLLCADGDTQALREALQRYVFRSKVTLAVREELAVAGTFTAADARGNAIDSLGADAVVLDMGSAAQPRSLRIASQPAGEDAEALAQWRAFDLCHGLPRLQADQREQWTPQQLSLTRLAAYSVKKGCYPGQEIVARTHFLGQAKRGLVLLETAQDIAVGSPVVDAGGQRLGDVVSIAAGVALAVMGEPAEGQTLQAGGHAVDVRSLRDGLAH